MAGAEKISVSLAAEDLAWAKKRAKTHDKSLSSVLSEALRRERQAEARLSLLAELGTDDIAEQDREQVRSEWRRPLEPPRSATSSARARSRKPKSKG
jgi:hypothetical protein